MTNLNKVSYVEEAFLKSLQPEGYGEWKLGIDMEEIHDIFWSKNSNLKN